MNIVYRTDITPETEQIIEVYNSSGIRRPTTDAGRIATMYAHSNLIVSAWDEMKLVGVARSLTDFSYCCYLSDLAVRAEYQRSGIGSKLIELTRSRVGAQSMLLLLAVPSAMEYYPKVGMQQIQNAFLIRRLE